MEVFINNQSVFVHPDFTLYTLLSQHNLADKKGIAVAVNNDVVHKGEWNIHTLKEKDTITIIRATQGG